MSLDDRLVAVCIEDRIGRRDIAKDAFGRYAILEELQIAVLRVGSHLQPVDHRLELVQLLAAYATSLDLDAIGNLLGEPRHAVGDVPAETPHMDGVEIMKLL